MTDKPEPNPDMEVHNFEYFECPSCEVYKGQIHAPSCKVAFPETKTEKPDDTDWNLAHNNRNCGDGGCV